MEDDKSFQIPNETHTNNNTDHGWQKVTYKKTRKTNNKLSDLPKANGSANNSSVFTNIEKHAAERRRKIEAERSAMNYEDEDEFPVKSKNGNVDDDVDYGFSSDAKENNANEANKKKEKVKKVKKPKVTVAEAAAEIDSDGLSAFLAEISESFVEQQDIQLMRFADYFAHVFGAVGAAQFPWLKLFKESAVAKIADIPVSYISEAVYMTSVDWINQRSNDALRTFAWWAMDEIVADLSAQLPGSKGSKKGGQPQSSKSKVALFLVLAMVLRRKPDVLISLAPELRENAKYQGQDKLPVIVWMTVQASQGDLAVGLYLWAHLVLPIHGGKSGSNPYTRDLVLQLAERIISAPKARSILLNSAVRKGERLVPPAALDQLLHLTFPASSARVKATERFEAIYPVLKEVALAGSPGSKAMKQVSQQIQTLAIKTAGEALSHEAAGIFLWSLTQTAECYTHWDKIYVNNIEASVVVLKMLSEDWKGLSVKQSSLQVLAETIKSFRRKNEKALGVPAFMEADKYCKTLLGKLSSGFSCLKTMALAGLLLGVAAAVVSPNLEGFDWDKLQALLQ